MTSETALPAHVRALFWEGLAEEPDPERHGEYIAIRVLEAGYEDDVRWLFEQYGRSSVRAIVDSGRLRARPAEFWRHVLTDA